MQGTHILVDDSALVCADALLNGILPYQVTPRWHKKPQTLQIPEPLRTQLGPRHGKCLSLKQAWEAILKDFESGALLRKIEWCAMQAPPLGTKVGLVPSDHPVHKESGERPLLRD